MISLMMPVVVWSQLINYERDMNGRVYHTVLYVILKSSKHCGKLSSCSLNHL